MAIIANNLLLSAILLIAALAIFFIMSIKGYNTIICGLVVCVLGCLASTNGWQTALTSDLITGASTMLSTLFLLFMSGCVLGAALEMTGSSQAMADVLIRKMGAKNIVWALLIFYAVLCIAGLSTTMWMFAAVALPMLRKADLPKSLGMLIIGISFAAYAINFSPNAYNAMWAASLGTYVSFTSAPLVSFPCAILGFSMVIFFIYRELKSARAEGRGYHHEGEVPSLPESPLRKDDEKPSSAYGFLAIIVTIVVILLLQEVCNWGATAAAVTTQLAVAALLILVCHKKVNVDPLKACADAMLQPASMLIGAIFVAGFAQIINANLAYSSFVGLLSSLSINPYVLCFITIALLSAITGSSVVPMLLFMQTLAPTCLTMGASPDALARLAIITAVTFDSLPHSFMVHINMGVFGHTLKTGYKYFFSVSVLMTTCMAVLALILCLVFY